MESSYATSKGCKTVLQSEPRRQGSLRPGLFIPGNCSGHLSDTEHMLCYYKPKLNDYTRLCEVSVLRCCCMAIASAWMQEASWAAWIAKSLYSCCSPVVNVCLSKLHSSRNLLSSARLSGLRVSWCLISLSRSFFVCWYEHPYGPVVDKDTTVNPQSVCDLE